MSNAFGRFGLHYQDQHHFWGAKIGTPFDDVLHGSSRSDVLIGGDGDDALFGYGGNDLLLGGNGNDWLDGGAGNDLMHGDSGDDALIGGSGNDLLSGGDGNDTLEGGAGNDILAGDEGDDWLDGGRGNDIIVGGEGGTDVVTYEQNGASAGAAVFVDLLAGVAVSGVSGFDLLVGIEAVIGSDAGDVLRGDNDSNYLDGAGGDDLLEARGGDDWLQAGAGNDILDGGDGIDTATFDWPLTDDGVTADLGLGTAYSVSTGSDTLIDIENLKGSQNDDVLLGDGGDNRIEGIAGDDLLDGGDGDDYLDGGDGNDVLHGGAGANVLFGGGGDDVVLGGDEFDYVVGGEGDDDLDGGGEQNFLVYKDEGGGNGVTVNLEGGWAIDSFGDTDTIANFTTVLGTDQADTIIGSTDSTFHMLVGMAGADTFVAGNSNEFVSYAIEVQEGGGAGVTVNLAEGWAIDSFGDTDTLVDVHALHGTNFADNVVGSAGDDFFQLFAGDDIVDGNGGWDMIDHSADIFWGATSADNVVVDLAAGTSVGTFSGSDTLIDIDAAGGTQGDDTLLGNAGDNWLGGNEGDDIIEGRGGNDWLVGGDGDDSFIFHLGFGQDTIEDFVCGVGSEDVIQFDSADFADFAEIQSHAANDGGDVVITSDNGDTLRLLGVQVADLTSTDFAFV